MIHCIGLRQKRQKYLQNLLTLSKIKTIWGCLLRNVDRVTPVQLTMLMLSIFITSENTVFTN